MYPAPIESLQSPTTINEVLRQLTATGDKDTLAIAGGMSLMQAMKARVLRPDALIDLNGISELRGITREGRDLRIGAMTRYVDLASAPELQDGAFAAIADAARHVGDRQVRNRGTIGGSLCWNDVAACTPVAALATEATLVLSSLDGAGMVRSRSVVIDDFLTGPMETAREPHELLRTVLLPRSAERSGSAYQKWGLSTATLSARLKVRRFRPDSTNATRRRRHAVDLLFDHQRLAAASRSLSFRDYAGQ
jgi:aerobic carbon-monoxide dehydrogenase medium subunit